MAVHPTLPADRRTRSQPVLLWLQTAPLTDLRWFLYLIPLWWMLGVEQLVWPIFLLVPLIKIIQARRGRVHVPAPARWLGLFLIVYLLSGASIVETTRLITFGRNFAPYLAAFFLILILANVRIEPRSARLVVDAAIGVMIAAALVGLLGILDLAQPQFQSGLGYFLPGFIRNTNYGARIAVKGIGGISWFSGIGDYYRVRSIFMYSTLYASALAAITPMILFRLRHSTSRWGRSLLLLGLLAVLTNLLFTTARTAILALVAGGFYFWLWVPPNPRRIKWVAGLGIVSLILLLLYFAAAGNLYILTDPITEGTGALLAARGGSTNSRIFVYQQTLLGWLQRPFLGWGTERDIPGFPLPAGSHSHYLGILYKQGLIGLILFLGMGIALWRQTAPQRAARAGCGRFQVDYLRYARWTFVTVALNAATDVLELDALTFIIIWTILGLALSLYLQYRPHLPISKAMASHGTD